MRAVLSVVMLGALVGCSGGGASHPVQPTADSLKRMDVVGALRLARIEAPANVWQLGLVSNTGVSQTVQGQSGSGVAALLNPEGKAGQWVFEFFSNTPRPIVDAGRKGFAYPFRIVLVDQGKANALPDSTLNVPSRFTLLPDAALRGIGPGEKAAVAKLGRSVVAASVASGQTAGKPTQWVFRLYTKASGEGSPTVIGTRLDGTQAVVLKTGSG